MSVVAHIQRIQIMQINPAPTLIEQFGRSSELVGKCW
jgi:hypothetical protein